MSYTKQYEGKNLDYIAFPLGGIGAGMFSIEGTGAFSSFSLRNEPNVNLEPCMFSALTIKGKTNVSRVLEGQVPRYKIFGGTQGPRQGKPDPLAGTKANGLTGTTYGLARFEKAVFRSRFPFAAIDLEDSSIPLKVSISAWSPFTPPDPDDSSYPFAFVEYTFENPTDQPIEAVYYYNSMNFMTMDEETAGVYRYQNGFVLNQPEVEDKPWYRGAYCAFVTEEDAKVNTGLFRGGWFDPLTMLWNDIEAGKAEDHAYEDGDNVPSPGASLAVPFTVNPGESKTIVLHCCWYVPDSSLRFGAEEDGCCCCCSSKKKDLPRHKPWYSAKFGSVEQAADYMKENRTRLYDLSKQFTDTFYASTLPEAVMDAIGSNLSILKSPTVLRQTDGRLWCWEGCCDSEGCCSGSCTHVWNYAQALCNLFPSLERGLRQTEFFDTQSEEGHQTFRASLPIRPSGHDFYAASDGQLGGIIKVYRDFRILGDLEWLKNIWPQVKSSMDYCIRTWDKKREGVLVEPHHNTYDIEFWGPDGMCSSFYLGALKAMIEMCGILGEDSSEYQSLYEKGKDYLEHKLYNGEYFIQKVEWEGLEAKLPEIGQVALNDKLSPEAYELIHRYGPKYQYGNGCISDGVLGAWMAKISGLGDVLDSQKIKSHLESVFRYNFKEDFRAHSNPQRPGFCVGEEGGLLLCSWPHGDKPALPFPYSDEVWTGIEYQVASHLILMGYVDEGLRIVTACRDRYSGCQRNPYDEYECGHWYARAMASYSLIQAFTGIRYDAYEKTLHLQPKIQGDFQVFLATNTGYGLAGMKNGTAFVDVVFGTIDVQKIVVD
ncbi:MAG: GH116 family glycosyl hydrolase [Massiliimalia sp.]|jgi:uncharacterized protein (DUF608 family)